MKFPYFRRSSVIIMTRFLAGRPALNSYRGGGETFFFFFFFKHPNQTGCRAHPAIYRNGTGGTFPRVHRAGREADSSSPSSGEGENA
jgi:hypothetical protein